MRKGVGISGLARHSAAATSYSQLSTSLTATQVTHLESSLASFRTALVAFAAKHRADIRADPAFRHQFQKMCAAIGVDPLGSGGSGGGGRGWWVDTLGLREWSCELALQVVDVCVSTRELNGGVIEMGELIARVERMRRGGAPPPQPLPPPAAIGKDGKPAKPPKATVDPATVTEDDIRRALELLHPLHAGYTFHSVGGTTFVRSVPRALDTDQSMLLVLASETGGRLTERIVADKTGWSAVRSRTALDDAVLREGLAWVDAQDEISTVWLVAAVDFADA